jgi:parallel beta-helix repeat protein
MNKKLVACTLLALLPAMALGITLYRAKILANPSSTDRIVDPRGPPYGTYKTISAALAASADGDVIWVNNGTYNEQLLVNKSVTIKSSFPSNRAVVNGSSTGMDFYVNASNVQLINLTIQNAREGICLSPTAIDTTLIGNVVRSNTYGISVNSGGNFLRQHHDRQC